MDIVSKRRATHFPLSYIGRYGIIVDLLSTSFDISPVDDFYIFQMLEDLGEYDW